MRVFLGMTVMVHVDGTSVVLSSVVPDSAVPVRASLLLSLLPLGVATTTGSVGFYSGTPGAFVALAGRCLLDLQPRWAPSTGRAPAHGARQQHR